MVHDLPVHAGIAAQAALGRPLFEVEEIAEELICPVLFEQPQAKRGAEMTFEQRSRLLKLGQHPRGVGGVFRGLVGESGCLPRLQREAPMQIDAAEARRFFQKRKTVVHEHLRDRAHVARLPGQARSPT